MAQVLVGGGLAITAAVLAAWFTHYLDGTHRRDRTRLDRLAMFAGERITAYAGFRRATVTFQERRLGPTPGRHEALKELREHLERMWIVGDTAINPAVDLYELMSRECSALHEFVLADEGDGELAEDKRSAVYRLERDEEDERAYLERLAELDRAFLNAARKDCGVGGQLARAALPRHRESQNDAGNTVSHGP